MPILGVDYEKCTGCGACIAVCPSRLFGQDKEKDQVVFYDQHRLCILCGHCIAGCQEDAIVHGKMGESHSFEGVDRPEIIISYDAMYNFLRAHRSVRHYRKERVPANVLQKVFDAMQHAPTARNMRAESYLILSEEGKIKALSDAVQETLLSNPATKAMYGEKIASLEKEFHSPMYYDAPHVVLVFSALNMEIESNNIGIIVTYGRLASQSLGLGTCWNGWTQVAMEFNPKIKELAGVRGSKVGVFTIGYPDVNFYRTAPRLRKSVQGLE